MCIKKGEVRWKVSSRIEEGSNPIRGERSIYTIPKAIAKIENV
jgi:hypothetical protein